MSLSWTFLASAWQISPEVDAESTRRLRVRPSIRVTVTTIGLLVLVAWHRREKEAESLWLSKVLLVGPAVSVTTYKTVLFF